MKATALILSLAITLSHIASAEQIAVQLSSPQEKYNGGIFLTGAYPINQIPQCSPDAVLRIVGPKLLTENSPLRFANGQTAPVGSYSKLLAADLNKIMQILVRAGDTDLLKRHVCVGAYDYGFVVNAISYSAGFILFDPKIVKHMYEELEGRSMYSLKQVLYHELAHQFQYWYKSEFFNDNNARRLELTADCVGAALAALEIEGLSEDIYKISADGIVNAVSSLGDFEAHSKNHHGTPIERAKAANFGISFIKGRIQFLTLKNELNAKNILKNCEQQTKSL
jgi:hypothetical protein